MKRIPGIICILWMALSCQERQDTIHQTAFSKVAPDTSSVHFSNDIEENDTLNYYTFPYLYMGGGVAIGDINNDGLQDVFFTGNRSANKLYLNQGDFRFRDITQDAGISGDDRWYTGVTMADVNHDGWLDIYVCASGIHGSTTNQLYINQKDQTFSEEAKAYGLADDSPSIQSTFFDFDRDGYLDVFVANYPQLPVSQGNLFYHDRMMKNEWHESGHLYRNEGNGFFQDVTEASGVQNFGLSLGVVATDFNNDGWTDLYLSNDFNVPDYLYLNNQNGTFREVVKESTAHTSMFGMGVDAGDFNNDGWMDFAQVDMTPSDHKRSKTNMASMSPKTFYQAVDLGLHYQYMHNMVQLNNGTRQQLPLFSDVSQLLNVAKTDWSWGILFSDLNNDGLKDLFITNGILRDVNNNDANRSFEKASFFGSKSDYKKLPTTPIKNYAFQNNGNLSFTEKSREWGLEEKGFSNGVSYGDLDNDGALDLVVNNINAPASLYRNLPSSSHHFLRVNLRGPKGNPLGLGSKTEIWSNDAYQSNELTLTRGFQSSVEPIVHFGLGKSTTVDKVKVTWPDGRVSIEKNVSADQLMTISYVNSQPIEVPPIPIATPINRIKDKLLPFRHQEDEYNDFVNEPLLPHKNSTLGPASAVGDINQDSLDDVFIGNASGSVATLFTQNKLGGFERYPGPWEADSAYEDTGSVFIDIDQDGDLDLYVVSGGNDPNQSGISYQDRLYLNVNGAFKKHATLPDVQSSGKVALPMDFDSDGDMDLFVGGRIVPGKYPFAPQSILLENRGGQDEELILAKVDGSVLGELETVGMITAASWADLDQDGKSELIVVGEWMGIEVFQSENGRFSRHPSYADLRKVTGWWRSLSLADIDQDGDTDLLVGNIGLNYKYKASKNSPFMVFANDFDENGTSDIVLSYEKSGKRLPLRGRECSSEQVPAIARRFKTFEAFADASLEEIYGIQMLESSLSYEATTFEHLWLENKGNSLEAHPLPRAAQISSVEAILPFDYDGDSYPDFILGGNLHDAEVETTRSDASVGLILQGTESGTFQVIPPFESGLMVKGEIRHIHRLHHQKDTLFVFLKNDDPVELWK